MDLLQLARRQRSEIDAADEANLNRIADAYALMYDRLQGDIDALVLAIQQTDMPPTVAEIKRMPQYQRLIRNMTRELDKFSAYLETAIGTAALAAIGLGLAHSEALVNSVTGGGFTGLDTAAMRSLLEYLKQDGPLYRRLAELTGSTIDSVVSTILDGVGAGFNPRKIASQIQDAFGGGLTDALRNMRTVQLYAYRDSARANYMATDGIVTKWIWWAELDMDVCMSCAAQHGTLHDLTETLNDHYNGRCAALPYIEGFENPNQNGQEWFDNLSEAEQKSLMGPSKWEAYKGGRFEFSQLSQEQDNEVYGKMRTEASLKSLLGE